MQVTMSAEGEIRIPKEMRERLRLEPGATMEIEVLGHGLFLQSPAVAEPRWSRLQGLVASGPSLTAALEEEHAAEIAHDEARS